MESKLQKYVGLANFLDTNWSKFFCKSCRGSGVLTDQFFVEIICPDCYGVGERPVLRPHIKMDLESYSLNVYGLFYITCLFHRFSDGHAVMMFLYDDLVWRYSRNSRDANCHFKYRSTACALLEEVT